MRKCNQIGYEHIEVLDSIWFSPVNPTAIGYGVINCIGMVKIRDEITDEIKCYIGYGKGENIIFDEDYIIANGNKLINTALIEWLKTGVKNENI